MVKEKSRTPSKELNCLILPVLNNHKLFLQTFCRSNNCFSRNSLRWFYEFITMVLWLFVPKIHQHCSKHSVLLWTVSMNIFLMVGIVQMMILCTTMTQTQTQSPCYCTKQTVVYGWQCSWTYTYNLTVSYVDVCIIQTILLWLPLSTLLTSS